MIFWESPSSTLLKLPPGMVSPSFGGPVLVVTSSTRDTRTTRRLPRPALDPTILLKQTPSFYTSASKAELFLYEEPHHSGFNPYLIISYSLSSIPLSPAQHEESIHANEYQPYTLRRFAPVQTELLWSVAHNSFQILRTRLTREAMSSIFAHYGNPEHEGNWLAARLLPRRRPSHLRLINPLLLHLWVRLF